MKASRVVLSTFLFTTLLLFMLARGSTGTIKAQSNLVQASELATEAAHFMLTGKYPEALNAVRKAQQLDPNRPDYLQMEGSILSAWVKDAYASSNTVLAGQYRAAIDAYERARRMFEQSGTKETVMEMRLKKAELAMFVNDSNTALRELQQILNAEPNNVPANYMYGVLLRNEYNQTANENLYIASKQAFERAVVNNRNVEHNIPYAYFYVGVSRLDAGRNREALVYLQLWIHQIRNSGKVLDGMDRFMVELAERYINELR